jgi:hypothetical protein
MVIGTATCNRQRKLMPKSASRRLRSRSVALVTATSLVLGGCATASKDIVSTYVSPLQYQSYDCAQLAAEGARIQSRVTALGGRLDKAADNDKALTGVGLVLFWPALFFLGGTKDQEAEYGRLKGEYDAVQQAAIQKSCPLTPLAAPATAASAPAASSPAASEPTAAASQPPEK